MSIYGNTVGTPMPQQGFSGDEIEEAVNSALAAAKESGEFDGPAGPAGPAGKDGQDGYTPVKGVDYFDGAPGKDGNPGADGYTPVKGKDYFDGQDGSPGKDGSNGVSATHSWNGTVLTVTSASGTSSADLKGATGNPGKDGSNGQPGADGVSPTVAVSKSGKVTTVAITDKNGTKTVTINDGADGSPGSAGKDGTSVTVKSVSESTADGGSNVVTFSDGKTVTIKNGSKGSKGDKGDRGDTGPAGSNGTDGKTPIRGTDYWTHADQDAITQQVLEAISQNVIGDVDEANNILITAPLAAGTYTLGYENADGSVTEIGSFTVSGSGGESGPAYTNLADHTSSEWLTNQRINSSKNVVDVTQAQRGDKTVVVTNRMDITGVSKLHIKGLDIINNLVNGSSNQNFGRMYVYKDGAIYLSTYQPSSGVGGKTHYTYADYDSSVVILDVAAAFKDWGYTDITQISLGGILTGAAEDVIITADENIV